MLKFGPPELQRLTVPQLTILDKSEQILFRGRAVVDVRRRPNSGKICEALTVEDHLPAYRIVVRAEWSMSSNRQKLGGPPGMNLLGRDASGKQVVWKLRRRPYDW